MKPKIKNLKILPLIIEQDELLNQTLKCRYKHTEIFLKDLACALYFKSFHYDYKVNASYLNLFLKLNLGGFISITNGSRYFTGKTLLLFKELTDVGGLEQILKNLDEVEKVNQNFEEVAQQFIQPILDRVQETIFKEHTNCNGYTKLKQNKIPDIDSCLQNEILNNLVDKSILNRIMLMGSQMFTQTYNNLINSTISYDNILDNSDLFDLLSYENLAMGFVHDINGYFYEKNMLIDIYVDISNSMHKNYRILSQGIAYILWKQRVIDNIYYFDTDIYDKVNYNSIKTSTKYFSKAIGVKYGDGGGTDYTPIFNNINSKNKKPSIIITDGYADVIPYSKYITFLMLSNGTKQDFNYYKNKQVLHYSSTNQNISYASY